MQHRFLTVASLLLLTACSSTTAQPEEKAPEAVPQKPAMEQQSDTQALTGKHTVTLETSMGDIVLELDADAAPKTATNFVTLAERGYYTDILFHRVIPGFMIQGGDPEGTGRGGDSIYGETFEDETDTGNPLMQVGYKEGAVAMANRGPDTNGSQFFIMDTDYGLPPNYTIFGRVTSGIDVVHAIARADRNGNDRPLTDITFTARVGK